MRKRILFSRKSAATYQSSAHPIRRVSAPREVLLHICSCSSATLSVWSSMAQGKSSWLLRVLASYPKRTPSSSDSRRRRALLIPHLSRICLPLRISTVSSDLTLSSPPATSPPSPSLRRSTRIEACSCRALSTVCMRIAKVSITSSTTRPTA